VNQFGNMLRRERKEQKLTLGDLARKMGISVPYLSQIETGTKPVQEALSSPIDGRVLHPDEGRRRQ
jgi:transcriptional regulator with XRE-family HTH domain